MNAEPKPVRIFTYSAGALLLALASACFLVNLTAPKDLVQPHDPVFALAFSYVYWAVGGLGLAVGLLCLFGARPALSAAWVGWLATSFLVYRIGLISVGCRDLTGFLDSVTYAFGISARTASVLADTVFAYLLGGSYAVLFWGWVRKRSVETLPAPVAGQPGPMVVASRQGAPGALTARADAEVQFKNACGYCGGKIQFSSAWVGQKLPCPHCAAAITLRQPPEGML